MISADYVLVACFLFEEIYAVLYYQISKIPKRLIYFKHSGHVGSFYQFIVFVMFLKPSCFTEKGRLFS